MPANSTQPNLLFVFADQLRAQTMGCYGDNQVKTPNLDALAASGIRFGHAYSNSPVCTPARGSLLTGNFPLSHGAVVNDVPLASDCTSIAHVLKDSGYATGYIGKWHLDGVPRDRFTPPERRFGFDYWRVWNCSHAYLNAKYYADNPDEPIEVEGYEPIAQTDLALEFIETNQEKPWCLYLSWGPPHDPYDQVPQKYLDMYDPDEIKLRGNVPDTAKDNKGQGWRQDPYLGHAGYYAHMTALDDQMGRLMEKLEQLQLADDTIVVFTSDHGDMLWSHGRRNKQRPYSESIDVPLLVRWPAELPQGAICDGIIGLTDLAPTLLSLMDREFPEPVHGTDLSSMCYNPLETGLTSCFIMDLIPVDQNVGEDPWRGVRTQRYTYVENPQRQVTHLFDNVVDPLQLHNLADDYAGSDLVQHLGGELQRWLDHAEDPFLDWDDQLRRLGLVELWNKREHFMHRDKPRTL